MNLAKQVEEEPDESEESKAKHHRKRKDRYATITGPKIRSFRAVEELERFGFVEPEYKCDLPPDPKAIQLDFSVSKKKKTIYDIKKKTEEEFAAGTVRAELEEAEEAYAEEWRNQERRYKELSADFKSEGRYVDKKYDHSLRENPNLGADTEELVQRLMSATIDLDEDANGDITRRRRRPIDAKVADMLVQQLDRSKIKRSFEKITSLLGVTKR